MADEENRYEGLPESWSDSARETYVQVEEDLGDDAATLAALYEACALLARADALAEAVDEEGFIVDGSRSRVVNPLIPEERHARTAAMGLLKSLGRAPGQSGASAAGAALVSKRWQGRTPGRRSS
ncbi:hypothetical protein [Nocardioides sp. GXQ0305]|uniref:hypothetical protein n=1 Tax=Nocardioides sp. GXQ0305 TaxID=3423912 RepID=UPI003D7DC688